MLVRTVSHSDGIAAIKYSLLVVCLAGIEEGGILQKRRVAVPRRRVTESFSPRFCYSKDTKRPWGSMSR